MPENIPDDIFAELASALSELTSEAVPITKTAILGFLDSNGDWQVPVDGEGPRVYVTIDNNVIIAINDGVPLWGGYPIVVTFIKGREPVVSKVEAHSAAEFVGGLTTLGAGPHSHRWGYGGVDMVESLRFEPGLVLPAGNTGLLVDTNPSFYIHEGLKKFFPANNITPALPATVGYHYWGVVGIDTSLNPHNLGVYYSPEKIATEDLTIDEALDVVFPGVALMAIALREEMTGYDFITDFQDLRLWPPSQVKNNYTATVPPDPLTDDISLGYERGSAWTDTSEGRIYICLDETLGAAVWREHSLDVFGAWNGVFQRNFDCVVTESGGIITASLDATNGGDLEVKFSDGFTTLDTDPSPLTVVLTAGTATVPQINHIYILQSTGLLTAKTSTYLEDWPSAEHAPVSIVILRTAAITQTDGALGNQNINNRPENDNADSQGWMQIVGNHLRSAGPKWLTGVTPTVTIVTNGGAPDDVYLANTSGLIRQFNPQTFPAFDMMQYAIDAVSTGSKTFTISDDGDLSSTFPDGKIISVHDSTGNDGSYTVASTSWSSPDFVITVSETISSAVADGTIGDDIHIINRNGAAYTTVSNLNGELSDANGTSMSGKYFWITYGGIINKSGEISHLVAFLPDGSYNTQANALADVSATKVRSFPTDWDNTGFLIAETLFRHQPAASGTWTEIETNTLLTLTGGTGGGAIVDPITSFSDAIFDWFNSTDPTKLVEVDLSGLTTATTRTLTMPDKDGTIALVGAAQVKKHVVIAAEDFKLGATPPTEAVIGNFPVRQFTIAAAEDMLKKYHVPTDWAVGTDITFSVRWAPVDANAGTVVWQMTYDPVAVGELISGAGTTTSIADATETTQDKLQQSGDMTIAGASLALGDTIGITIFRDPAHGSDDYASSASLVELHIEYTSDKLGEDV